MARIRGLHGEIIKNRVKKILKTKKYDFFDGKAAYNVNIVGIRNLEGRPNYFDDILMVIYRDNHKRWLTDSYQITTDPGVYWLKKPMNVSGTAILCPGQYGGAYKIDKHLGKYDALCQRGAPITVWRDNNRDFHHDLDDDSKDTGYFGVNIHKAGRNSSQVDKWSAGCQVFKNEGDFDEFMTTMKNARARFGNKFTYTLLERADLEEEADGP
tara:strand:- start:2688 stop:3323 length:636 start_codon:yes stop_codon:yes gene_type:complete